MTHSAVITIIFTVFALGDAIIKGVSANFTLWQIFFLRSVIIIPILIVLLRLPRWRASLILKHIGWALSRFGRKVSFDAAGILSLSLLWSNCS
jgi:hypothetical protein